MKKLREMLTIAGAFVAWNMGAGFATGQEALRYFSSYGCQSVGVFVITCIGVLSLVQVLFMVGFEQKSTVPFHQFVYFCGPRLGSFYGKLIPSTLVLLISVLFSCAGARLSEHYGIHPFIGSACMAVAVLIAYLIGFKRLVRVVSFVGPLMIVFVLMTSFSTVWSALPSGDVFGCDTFALADKQAAPHWLLSGILYVSLVIFPGSTYFVNIGHTSDSRRSLRWGGFLGSVLVLFTIAMLNVAILLHAEEMAHYDVPMLALATLLSPEFAMLFSISLTLGVFSSCAVMMWSVCSRFPYGGRRGNVLFSVGVACVTFVLSLFPFGELVGVFYPFIGYLGLIFIAGVIKVGIINRGGRQY